MSTLTPSTQCYLFPILICFFHVETHKVSTSIWGEGVSGFPTQAMTWTGSFCTFIVHGPWTGSKTVQIWLKLDRIHFADNLRWKFHLFLSEPGSPGSQKLTSNGFIEWIFLRNKENACQNWEYITLSGGGYAGRRIKFTRRKSLYSNNLILRNFFKVNPVISWNGQNSFQRIFPSNSRHFTTPLRHFRVHFFSEKSRSNIWGIYESTPQPQGMNTEKRISRDLRFPS